MKTQQFKTLGLNVNLSVPTTVEEFDSNAKRAGACLEEATNNVIYRGSLAELRDLIIHGRDEEKVDGKVTVTAFKGLEEVTGVARKTKKVKSGKEQKEVEVYDETEGEYIERLVATKKVELSTFQSHFDAAAALVAFDASARERKPAGPKKLAEKFKTIATEFLSGKKSLEKLNAALTKSISKTFTKTGDVEKDTLALGWLCKEYADAQDVFAKVG
jgi:hypothetical protein